MTEVRSPGGADALTLEYGLKRLALFRVVMVTTLLLVAIYVEAVAETLLATNPLYFLIAATYALTLVHIASWRLVRSRVALAWAQVVSDLVVITGLVYVAGGTGPRANFALLYPISVLSGATLLGGRRASLLLAGIATLFYAGILQAVRAGVVPPQGLAEAQWLPVKQVLYSIFVVGMACGTVATIGAYLSGSLKSVGRQLEIATEQVADLRELNQVIVDSIQSGLITTDADGRVLYVNRYGETILGRGLAELRGLGLAQALGSRLLDVAALEVRATSGRLARLELAYARPDGRSVGLGVSVSPLATREPGRRGHLVVFQDLTEIKRLEEEVRTKEKLAAVGEVAAQLAHEIRNPLGSISGSAQVLMEEPLESEQKRLLAIITRESRRLSDTLSRFLFQVRGSGRPLQPVDIGPVIAEAIELLRNGPEVGPHHEVRFVTDGTPHVCLADPDQISQVFWNLARNGLEAMPHGGLLEVRLARRDSELELSVRDEGRGLAREEQRRMFETFHSTRPGGTGLGLAIVYRIVREHHGDIAVKSVPEHGTAVVVRLPLAGALVVTA